MSHAANGAFVVAWGSQPQDGYNYGIFARRFDAAGNMQGVEFQVNVYTETGQDDPSVSLAANGDFVVAWESTEQDGGSSGIFARAFTSTGEPRGGELQVNSYTPSGQYRPSVAAGADGDFVITWDSAGGQDGSTTGVFMRGFNSAGHALVELQVSTFTQSIQSAPSVAASGSRFVVAWQSDSQDGSGFGVFAQRFATLAVLDVDGDGEELTAHRRRAGAALPLRIHRADAGDRRGRSRQLHALQRRGDRDLSRDDQLRVALRGRA